MTILFSDDFSGADGTPWDPSKWITIDGQANLTGDGRGRLGSNNRATQQMTKGASAVNQDLTVTLSGGAPDATYVYLRSSGRLNSYSYDPEYGYRFDVNLQGGTARIYRVANSFSGSPYTMLGEGIPIPAVSGTQQVRFRIQVIEGTIRLRAWLAGSSEPTTWNATITDPSPVNVPGEIGLLNLIQYSSPAVLVSDLEITDGVAPPPTPSNPKAEPTATGATLTWEAVPGVNGYWVHRDGLSLAQVVGGDVTTYEDAAVDLESSHYYTLTSYNDNGVSAHTEQFAAIPPTPNSLLATGGDGVVHIQWDNVPYSTGHRLYKEGVLLQQFVSEGDSTFYDDTAVENGTYSRYTLTAYNLNGESAQSEEVSALPHVLVPPAQVHNLIGEIVGDTIVLSWDAAEGALEYIVMDEPPAPDDSNRYRGPDLTVTLTGPWEPGVPYSFTVHAVNSDGPGLPSEQATLTFPSPLAAPTNFTATGEVDRISLKWDLVPDATTYELFRDDVWAEHITTFEDGSAADDETEPGASHTYHVRAVIAEGETRLAQSDWSEGATAARLVPAGESTGEEGDPDIIVTPENLTATGGPGWIALKWDPVEGASQYMVYRWKEWLRNLEVRPDGSHRDHAVTPGVEYGYIVFAVINGRVSDPSEPAHATALPASVDGAATAEVSTELTVEGLNLPAGRPDTMSVDTILYGIGEPVLNLEAPPAIDESLFKRPVGTGAAYSYLVVDTLTGELLDHISPTSVRYGRTLNGAGAMSATLRLTDPKANLDLLADEARRIIIVERNGVVAWAGVLWTVSAQLDDNGDGTVNLGLEGIWSYYRRRRLQNTIILNQVDQADIARILLETARTSSLPRSDIHLELSTELHGVLRDRTYLGEELRTPAELVEALSSLEKGFDFGVESYWGEDKQLHHVFRTWYPARGIRTDIVWDLQVNIRTLSVTRDSKAAANVIHAIGAGEGVNTLRHTAEDPTAPGPVLEEAVSYKDVVIPDTLQEHAGTHLRELRRAVVLPSITLDTRRPGTRPGRDFFEGDLVYVTAHRGLIQLEGWYRVMSYDVSPDDSGNEVVSVVVTPEDASGGQIL